MSESKRTVGVSAQQLADARRLAELQQQATAAQRAYATAARASGLAPAAQRPTQQQQQQLQRARLGAEASAAGKLASGRMISAAPAHSNLFRARSAAADQAKLENPEEEGQPWQLRFGEGYGRHAPNLRTREQKNADARARYARKRQLAGPTRTPKGNIRKSARVFARELDAQGRKVLLTGRAATDKRLADQELRRQHRADKVADRKTVALAAYRSWDTQGIKDARSRGRTGAKKVQFSPTEIANGSYSAVKIALSKFPKLGGNLDSRVGGAGRRDDVFYPVNPTVVELLNDAVAALGGAAAAEYNTYTNNRTTVPAERKVVATALRFWPDLELGWTLAQRQDLLRGFNAQQAAWWGSLDPQQKAKYTNAMLARVSKMESNSARSNYAYKGGNRLGMLNAAEPVTFVDGSADQGVFWEASRSLLGGHIHPKQVQVAGGARAKQFRLAAADAQERLDMISRIAAGTGAADSKLQSIRGVIAGSTSTLNRAAKGVATAYRTEQMGLVGPSAKAVKKGGPAFA